MWPINGHGYADEDAIEVKYFNVSNVIHITKFFAARAFPSVTFDAYGKIYLLLLCSNFFDLCTCVRIKCYDVLIFVVIFYGSLQCGGDSRAKVPVALLRV